MAKRQLRNEVCYAAACACEECREGRSSDFTILGWLCSSIVDAKKELRELRKTHDKSVFLVRETIEPLTRSPTRNRRSERRRNLHRMATSGVMTWTAGFP